MGATVVSVISLFPLLRSPRTFRSFDSVKQEPQVLRVLLKVLSDLRKMIMHFTRRLDKSGSRAKLLYLVGKLVQLCRPCKCFV